MGEQYYLLQAILQEPGEDVHRFVYADWLEDHGQSERAQFIRDGVLRGKTHQCITLGDNDRPSGGRHPRDVWPAAWYAWKDGLPRGVELIWRRGFVYRILLPIAAFLRHTLTLFSVHPIEGVCLSDREPERTTGGVERYPPLWCWSPERPTWDDMPARLPDSLFLLLSSFRTDLDHTWYSSAWRFYDTREEALADLSRACVAWGRQQVGLPPLGKKVGC